jgi:hypothetical protein
MYDPKRLVLEVAVRNGIRVEPGDPVFAFVTLSELVLDELARRVLDDVGTRLAAFEDSIDKADRRSGKLLAQEVRDAAAQIRAELHKDIDEAGLKAAHLVFKVHQAHSRPALIRWLCAGLVSAVGLFLAGLWVGAHCLGLLKAP